MALYNEPSVIDSTQKEPIFFKYIYVKILIPMHFFCQNGSRENKMGPMGVIPTV